MDYIFSALNSSFTPFPGNDVEEVVVWSTIQFTYPF